MRMVRQLAEEDGPPLGKSLPSAVFKAQQVDPICKVIGFPERSPVQNRERRVLVHKPASDIIG